MILEYSAIKTNSTIIELLINSGSKVLTEVNSSKHYWKQDLTSGLNQVHEVLDSQILKNPKDGDSTRFLENLLHWLITLTKSNLIFISNWDFPCCNLLLVILFATWERHSCPILPVILYISSSLELSSPHWACWGSSASPLTWLTILFPSAEGAPSCQHFLQWQAQGCQMHLYQCWRERIITSYSMLPTLLLMFTSKSPFAYLSTSWLTEKYILRSPFTAAF